MAAREFAHSFGRANVYQLTPWDDEAGRRSSTSEHLRGRLLFDKELHHDEIVHRVERGAQPKRTRLTDEFTYEDFQSRYGGQALPLFYIDGQTKRSYSFAPPRTQNHRKPVRPSSP